MKYVLALMALVSLATPSTAQVSSGHAQRLDAWRTAQTKAAQQHDAARAAREAKMQAMKQLLDAETERKAEAGK